MNTLLFIILIIVSLLFFYTADKKDNKKFLVLGILIISVLSGFRGINVGVDTRDYYNAFINNFPKSWQFEETGFRFITKILMVFFKNASIVMFIYALITNSLIFLRLWNFRKKCDFSLMSVLYILIYYISSMNIMRQFIAVAIIFFFTKLLEKKKYLLFFSIVLLVSLIHKTALLSLAFIFIYSWNSMSKKRKIVLGPLLLIILLIGLSIVLKYENNHVSNYISNNNYKNNFNITFFYRIFIFIFSWLVIKLNIVFVFKNNEKKINNVKNEKNVYEFNKYSFIYLLGLIFASIGLFYNNMSRVGLYYLCYEIIYWGYIIKQENNKSLNYVLIIVYGVYIFIIELIYNGSMIFPYYMFFGGV